MRQSFVRFSVIATAVLSLACVGSWSLLSGEDDDENKLNPIVGSWEITITGTPFRILRTYDASGGVIDAYSFPPFTPTPGPLINTPGHGTWVKTGRNQVKVLIKYFQLNPQNNATFQILDTFGTVAETVNMTRADAYTSSFVTSIFRPDGSLVLTNPGRTEGKRIKIEPLTAPR